MGATGYLVSAGVWVGGEGWGKPRIPVEKGRAVVSVPIDANDLVPIANTVNAYTQIKPPHLLLRVNPVGRSRKGESPPIEYGDFDDTYVGIWAPRSVRPNPRPADPIRRPVAQWEHIQSQIDQTIDFVACYTQPVCRFPLPEPKLRPNASEASDPFPFTQRDLDEWYPALLGQRNIRKVPEPPPPKGFAVIVRDSGQEDFYITWATQSPKPREAERPRRGGSFEVSIDSLADPYYFVQQVPPRRPTPKPIQFQVHPPWMSMFSIAVPGPYYVVAGQISPAAGAVAGEVKDAGRS